MANKIIFDTDMGRFSDDVIALLFALKHPEIELLGITSVYETAEKGASMSREMIELAKKQVPVYIGNNQTLEENSFQNSEAVDFLLDESQKHKGEYDLLCIGPLTNIAVAIKKDERFCKNVRKLFIMGGSIHRSYTRYSIDPEYNIAVDPDAARIVFESSIDKLIIPLDVTMDGVIGKREFERLRELGDLERKAYDFTFQGKFGEEMHDSLALAIMTNPEIATIEKMPIKVDIYGNTLVRGENILDVCMNFDYKTFRNIFDGVVFNQKR